MIVSIHKLILLTIIALSTASCAITTPLGQQNPGQRLVPDNVDVQIVATDLVSALMQLPGHEIWSMTVQVSPPRNDFGKAVTKAITDAGYGVQKVKADQGQNYVSYEKTVSATDTGEYTTFLLRVRDVSVFRNYRYGFGRWVPTSPLRIKGIEPSTVSTYDDLHFQDGLVSTFVSGVEFLNDTDDVVETTKRIVNIANPEAKKFGERLAEAQYLILSRARLFSKQRSIDTTELYNYTPVASAVLKFPTSDTSFIGQNNKDAIAELVGQMNEATDGFIIRGCSHGKSLLWDGTEGESLERQIRINTELLVSGVNHSLIREESCFPRKDDLPLPRQTVILTLRRRLNTI